MRNPLRLSQQVVNFLRLGFSACPSSSAARALVFAFASLLLLSSALQAQLMHRYSFSETSGTTVVDSVGGAHGTIVDAGTTTNFDWTGSQLNLSANTGEGSNVITEDAYVDLPNDFISSAVSGGAGGQVAFELWTTLSENHTWSSLYNFGTSDNGEDTSANGTGSSYIVMSANSGRYGDGPEITNHLANGAEPNVGATTQLGIGVEHQLFAVYNYDNFRSGPNGTMSFYIDGNLIGHNAIASGLDLNTFVNNNNWLGRSQWNDPIFDGSYNEFRIYDTAPADAYVTDSYEAGADSLAPFKPWGHIDFFFYATVDRDTGTITVVNASPAIDVVGISITSASGALVPANLLSVTDNYDSNSGGSFDPDDLWSVDSATTYEWRETEPDGDGGQLGVGGTQTSLLLGGPGACITSPYEDLVVTVQRLLPDFTTESLNFQVFYGGGIGRAPDRSDLDIDGDVDVDDYQILVAGHLTDLLSLTPATSWGYGDLNGDLKNNFADFSLFQQDYDAANGVGAFAALQASIPEPSTLTLVLLTGIACTFSRRRLT